MLDGSNGVSYQLLQLSLALLGDVCRVKRHVFALGCHVQVAAVDLDAFKGPHDKAAQEPGQADVPGRAGPEQAQQLEGRRGRDAECLRSGCR